MVIKPKIRGFICTTAHPVGCARNVAKQIEYVSSQGKITGAQNVLVIGASTGYGLASRIVASFACGAKTIGVSYEKEADERRTATPGWYNNAAFEKFARADGFYAQSINGDAFSDNIKKQTADLIRNDLGKIDLVIYSVASPRRIHPKTGKVYSSVLKPIETSFESQTVDAFRSELKKVVIEPANQQEIDDTIAVMGGEDWAMWLDHLHKENLLADGVKTVAYSYIGPELTHAIYKNGTIGQAKSDLKRTAEVLNHELKPLNGFAYISVNKAVVTQASAAIPVVPLYISLLFKVMKEKGMHEGCIEQIYRLFRDFLYANDGVISLDQEGYIRIDDKEMDPIIQETVAQRWLQVTNENLEELADLEGYRNEFYHLFGFNMSEVDYSADVDLNSR